MEWLTFLSLRLVAHPRNYHKYQTHAFPKFSNLFIFGRNDPKVFDVKIESITSQLFQLRNSNYELNRLTSGKACVFKQKKAASVRC